MAKRSRGKLKLSKADRRWIELAKLAGLIVLEHELIVLTGYGLPGNEMG